VDSWDPNDIIGPGGYDDPATDIEDNWIAGPARLGYMIRFENDPEEATAPAMDVVITSELDEDVDLSTFELGDIGWGEVVVEVPSRPAAPRDGGRPGHGSAV
jgi:hypothetical protein